ncbi:MAG TPA: shikimate dehydrogenase [Lichenihabitans sp.]|jgi:shikimate dehydrogenase|nr:shikimate dehydrogenase [Lichenihabitans sp.]
MSPSPRAFVIGHPIAHSRSPMIHGFWLEQHGLDGAYEKIDVPPEALRGFLASLRAHGYRGGNVTVPHKTEALRLAGGRDAAAEAIGAANTLWFDGDRLVAGNTDAAGFLGSLDAEAPGWDHGAGRAVVLGAGGAARAVVHALLARGFAIDLVNRTPDKGEALARDFGTGVRAHGFAESARLLGAAGLLVNTTSLGMAGQPPLTLDLGRLERDAAVCDIVYVPLETGLMRAARQRGHRVVGGLGMLLHQAVPGFERWFGVRPSVTPELRALIEADIRAKP